MRPTKTSKAKSPSDEPIVVNGWTILAHPQFLDQLEKLTQAVEAEAKTNPKTYKSGANPKLLASIHNLVFNEVPEDPTREKYRQGNTLGGDYKHWFRAKFGNGRFRLFFRYAKSGRIIIFAWVNDANTLREYGSKTDAYAVFASMLAKGNPPDEWGKLLEAANATLARLRGVAKQSKE